MRTPPTGTVTFLFTDIEGSTALWEERPDAMSLALARHDDLLRQAVEGSGGYVVKTTGDGIYAAFATAPEAVQAALTAQRTLAVEAWEPEAALSVRMGLHTGGGELRDGDYHGGVVNRAARLMKAGHGGQILLSAATQELVRDRLPAGAFLRELGTYRLKDLGRPERVFQLRHPSLPADFPPLRSLDSVDLPNNLPQQMTSFIGREREIREVKVRLSKSRLVTLTGAGGAGKTRLSLQVAADVLDEYRDGVWLVELANLSDPALVPLAVAQALGVREEAGTTPQKTLRDALRFQRLLLILDNCEHLVSACASLAADLLRSCPGVHLLVSSREPLKVSGEQTYRVPSLSLPDPEKPETVESLSQYESVALFIERARAVQPSFVVTNANAPAVAQVCFHLDGIPLAIELAAARVRSLPVEEVNARLDQRFRLLTGGSRTALPRQQTLRALVDWSYDLLTEQEKVLLGRLSVFVGGWTLEAAEAIGVGKGIAGFEVLDLLTGLVDKSLVVFEEGNGAGRYRLLETMRRYALDRLTEDGEAEAVQAWAAAWFLDFAEQAETQLMGSGQASWCARLDTEHDNLRAALAWAEHSPDPSNSLRLVGALWRFWFMRGHYSEGRQWSDRALTRADGLDGGEASAARARALNGAGNLADELGDYTGARALQEESLAIQRRLEDPQAVAALLSNLGSVAARQGDYGAAQALFEESLTGFRQLENPRGISGVLGNLGILARGRGDYVGARTLFEESLILARQLGNAQGIAATLNNLGTVAESLGDYAGAQASHKESLAIQRQLGHPRGIANSLSNLGNVAFQQGDLAGARALQEESLTLRRQIGEPRGIGDSLGSLGNVASEQGDYAGARALFVECLTIQRQLGNQRVIALSLEGMAGVAHGQGQSERAARLGGAAASLRESLGSPRPPVEQVALDAMLASARAVLGGDSFSAAWDAGRAMPGEQAVEYALAGGE